MTLAKVVRKGSYQGVRAMGYKHKLGDYSVSCDRSQMGRAGKCAESDESHR